HSGKTQIISHPGLPKSINWTGGEVVIRSQIYILDRVQITSQTGDTLNVVNNSNYTPVDGWGYFIQNHPATLDQDGEWYYDAVKKTVRLFSGQLNPNTSLITATIQSRGIDVVNSTNIRIANLTITQTLNEGISATNVSSFTLVNNEVTNSGEDGINIKGSGRSILIDNNHIWDVNNNGVRIDGYKSVTFQNNSLRRIGLVAGRGKSGDGQYNGLQSTADENVLIEHNLIDSIGYNGLTFWNNTIIRQNIISNYCMTKNDGGGLYVWNHPMAPMTNCPYPVW
ncbi:MAG: right-handed parallel beta-helix repeat-containing protein, partial [Cytophagaceae bacterium]